jgi:hypothetical protein
MYFRINKLSLLSLPGFSSQVSVLTAQRGDWTMAESLGVEGPGGAERSRHIADAQEVENLTQHRVSLT